MGKMSSFDNTIREGVDRETFETVKSVGEKYKYGFSTDIEMEYAPKGVSEDIVKLISRKNNAEIPCNLIFLLK